MNSALASIMGPPPKVAEMPKVGDILVGCSGYEASYAHFAKVIGVTAHTVRLVPLPTIDRNYSNGGMDWESLPNLTGENGPAFSRVVKFRDGQYCVRLNDYTTMYKWEGHAISCFDHH